MNNSLTPFCWCVHDIGMLKPVIAVLGLIVAVPMAFAVAMPQLSSLQTQTYGVVPSSVEPLAGVMLLMGLLLVVAILFGLFWAIWSSVGR